MLLKKKYLSKIKKLRRKIDQGSLIGKKSANPGGWKLQIVNVYQFPRYHIYDFLTIKPNIYYTHISVVIILSCVSKNMNKNNNTKNIQFNIINLLAK